MTLIWIIITLNCKDNNVVDDNRRDKEMDMLMNVYIASWIFTGGAIFVVYIRHMRKLEKKIMSH